MKPSMFSFETLSRAVDERRREAAERADALVGDLEKNADIFAEYGVTRAVLFGSHAARRPRSDSDVDLLVYGLNERVFHSCMAALERRLGRDVDLHTMNERSGFVLRAVRTGIVVYEAK